VTHYCERCPVRRRRSKFTQPENRKHEAWLFMDIADMGSLSQGYHHRHEGSHLHVEVRCLRARKKLRSRDGGCPFPFERSNEIASRTLQKSQVLWQYGFTILSISQAHYLNLWAVFASVSNASFVTSFTISSADATWFINPTLVPA